MKAATVNSRSFLKERTIKYCIVMAFISIWLLVLVIYYTKGQSFMSKLQSSLFQFIISTNLITLALFMTAGVLQAVSMKRKVNYRCTSIIAEISILCFITLLQTIAAIALSAGTPSFACSTQGSCHESIFFAIVAWIAPLLFSIHAIEFFVRAKRLAAVNTGIWSMPAWTIDWEETLSTFNDINAVEKGVAPKTLILPQTHARKLSEEEIKEKVAIKESRVIRKSMPPPPPPKTPSSFEQCLLIIPNKLKYVVPRLGPAPKFFITIPDNIQYTVPRITAAPDAKERRKERRKARRAQSPSKWTRYLSRA